MSTSTLRVPHESDLALVARLTNLDWPEAVSADRVKRDWTAPDTDLAQDARVEEDGYGRVASLDHERVWIDLRGRPSGALLDWAEARAREKGTRLFTGAWSSNQGLLAELAARGFTHVRSSYRMEADLEGELDAPAVPDGVSVRAFQAGDERVFYDVWRETFEDTWEHVDESYESWSHWLLQPPEFDPELWLIAFDDREPAGIAICHPHGTVRELATVRILGVRRPWRRRGLGRALLLTAFAVFRERGYTRANLGVDAESLTGANRLYEAAGMRVAATFEIYAKDAP